MTLIPKTTPMVIHETVTWETLGLMWVETLRCAQGDTTTSVILSEAKNLASHHYLFDDHEPERAGDLSTDRERINRWT
jgi:hypothetical protein